LVIGCIKGNGVCVCTSQICHDCGRTYSYISACHVCSCFWDIVRWNTVSLGEYLYLGDNVRHCSFVAVIVQSTVIRLLSLFVRVETSRIRPFCFRNHVVSDRTFLLAAETIHTSFCTVDVVANSYRNHSQAVSGIFAYSSLPFYIFSKAIK
jgi:hypothetical protein